MKRYYLFLLIVPREAHFLKARWAKLVKVFIRYMFFVCYISIFSVERKV